MKYIELKSVPSGAIRGFTEDGTPIPFPDISFADHIRNMCQQDPNGMSVAAVRSAVRILDALDAQRDKTHLALEDADYDYLRARLERTTFTVASSGVVALIDAIESASTEAPVVAPVEEEAPAGDAIDEAIGKRPRRR